MRTMLIAPHADDETLFASYLAQQHAAHIVVVYDEGRQVELEAACNWLGCTSETLGVPKGAPERDVEIAFMALRARRYLPDTSLIIGPAWHEDGHEEHNLVAAVQHRVLGKPGVTYPTYAPRGQRDRRGTLVEPEPAWVLRKLHALACYRSQILQDSTRPWFYDLLDMREWVIG